ncbi:hypothetical protein SKC39_18155 [Mycolicibacterium sp. 120322]
MQVKRHVQVSGGFEDRCVTGIVQERATFGTVEKPPDASQFPYSSAQFVRGAFGLAQSEAGEHAQPCGMAAGACACRVVGVAHQRSGIRGSQPVLATGGQREDLHVDAAGVHGCDTGLVEIDQCGAQCRRGAGARHELAGRVEVLGGGEMLLQCHNADSDLFGARR